MWVTFEGTEGAGKSTLIRAIATKLKRARVPFIVTREPGGPRVSEAIRKIILSQDMNPWTELFLYEASRSEHVQQTILPALKKKKVVLCDRFGDSSLAYQSGARKLPWKTVKFLNDLASQGNRPKLSVFLDIDPATGLKRASDRNRFEHEGLLFQKKVKKGFQRAIREDKKRWLVLKIKNQSPEELADAVIQEMKRRSPDLRKRLRT